MESEKEKYVNNLLKLNPKDSREWAEKDWDHYQAHLNWCAERVEKGLPIGKEYDGIDETLDRRGF